MTRPTLIDLFSGAGGLSLGFEAAGFDVTASVEIDPIHCAVHKFNFPYTETFCADIRALDTGTLAATLDGRTLDLVVGGPPCQGFSQIGYRLLRDPRNRLVFEYVRIVRELKPRYFVFENVPGILAGEHRAFVEELRTEFRQAGYAVLEPIALLDAASFGVPQSRKRLIMMGYREDCPPPSYPAPTHGSREPGQLDLLETPMEPFVTVHDGLSGLEDTPVATKNDTGLEPGKATGGSRYARALSFDSPEGFGLCHRRSFHTARIYGHLGSSHTPQSAERFGATPPGSTEPVSRFHRLDPNGLCNTLRAGTDSARGAHTAARPIHHTQPRCISVREGARLHSYPDWFQFHRTVWHGFRQVGNSVPPLLARALGEALTKALGLVPDRSSCRLLPPAAEELLSFNMTQASNFFGVDAPIAKRKRRAG